MRSAASYSSHPIHPMLIPFPLAFFSGALAFDVAGVLLGRDALWRTGSHLAIAGVVMAVVAAVPGAIDYFRSVPPESSGKSRARKHAAVNLGATVLFATAWLLRSSEPGLLILGMEAVGAGLLTMGGWMGGTLVYRNQIGVDHRYAGAGRWSHERLDAAGSRRLAVATADELERDQMKLIEVDGRRIVLARTEDGYVAFADHCTHRGASLADGAMICGTVQCPWHGSQFDVRTGEVRAGPADRGIHTYAVELEGTDVMLEL